MESAYGATVDINSTLRYSENRCNYAELVNFALSIKYFRGKQVQIFVNVNDFVPTRIINQSTTNWELSNYLKDLIGAD